MLQDSKLSTWISRGLWAVALAFLSLGGLLTLDETPPGELPQLSSAVASVDAGSVESGAGLGAADENAAGSVEYLSKPIRELRTMRDRVLAHNPQREETQAPLTDIDPQQWRVVTLHHDQPDGSRVTVERGLPLDAISAEGLSVGRTLDVYLPEFDVQGAFTVAEISACPTPASGPGQLVTSRFIHENAEVWDLTLEGSPEPLGTTSSHPFWSVDRESFIPASDLQPGERLQLADGTTRAVQTLTKRPGRTTVYNLEVDGEHVYYVGQSGVLVHNTCRSILLGQTMDRVNAVARANGFRTLKEVGWSWKRNRDFLYYAAQNTRNGRARIYDIGFDPEKGYHGPKTITTKEMKLLVRQGFQRRFVGWIENPYDGQMVRLFEWVAKQ
jgi:hypothetical protein